MKFRLNEDRELYEEFPITEPLLEKGDGGMGNTTQVICDLLDIVGCQGITVKSASDYVLHHKNGNHRDNRIYNLVLVPKNNNLHGIAHGDARRQTNPNTKRNQTGTPMAASYTKVLDSHLMGTDAIDVYASLYSGSIVYY